MIEPCRGAPAKASISRRCYDSREIVRTTSSRRGTRRPVSVADAREAVGMVSWCRRGSGANRTGIAIADSALLLAARIQLLLPKLTCFLV
jgi:hypothetical protein